MLALGGVFLAVTTAIPAAQAGILDASWTAPTSNVDSSPLTDLSAYRVYYGVSGSSCPGPSYLQVASPTSSPASGTTVNARLTGLTDGSLYYVAVTAVNTSGNESACPTSSSAVARVDFSVSPAATVDFGTVTIGSFADQTFTVQNTSGGTVSGTASVSAPFSTVSGGSFSAVGTGGTQAVTVRFTPTVVATASVNLIFTANGTGVTRVVTGLGAVDSTRPAVTIATPTSTAAFSASSSPMALGGTASDNVGVTKVTWTNDRGGSGTAVGTTSWTASGIALQPGANVLTVTARDAAGNTAAATLTVTLSDTTPPTVALTAPTAGATVTGALSVTATATDNVGVAGVQFKLDGANLGAERTTTPYSVSWDTTTAAGGSHTLTAVARDAAGNSTTSSPVVLTVAAPVVVAPVSVPLAASAITVDGSLGEWSGATAVQFSGLSNRATAYLLWDATNLYVAFQVSDSQLNATRTARDDGGIYLDDSVEIYIDTLNDRATVMQTDDYQFLVNLNNAQADLRGTGTGKDPAWNGTWRSAVRLQGTLNANTDTDSGYTVEIAIPWAQIGVTPVSGMSFGIDLAVNDSDPSSFDYFDWAGIAPKAFAQPSLWKQVRLMGTSASPADTVPPSVGITAPAAGAIVSGTVTVTATASDNVGVAGVQFKVDGAAMGAEKTAAPYAVAWNTAALSNGPHTLTAVARDAAGNVTTSAAVTASVNNDTTPPVLTAVAASAITSAGATISWTTNKASDTQVEYGLTTAYGTLTPLDTAQVMTHTRTLGALVAGTLYHYRVRSRDAAGNLGTSVDFTFTTAATTSAGTVIYKAATPITVDGVLNEWSGATAVQFSGRSNGATAYLLWDATNLYVAFQVSDSQLNATRTARDAGGLYLDDSVEIYIDTLNDRATVMQPDDYQFVVNLNNAQGDLRGTGTGKKSTWNGTWQSAIRLQGTLNANGDTDSGYTIEIAIPWAQIGVTPVSGMSFGIDLAVNDRDSASFDYFDWAGIAPNAYAQPYLWKPVRLE